MTNIVSLLTFTLMLAAGQLLFKRVGLSIHGLPLAQGLVSMLREPALYQALALYGVSTFLWVWILSRVPLSLAYPWVSVGVAVVPLIAWWFFGERPLPIFWLGVALIMVGLLLTQYGSLRQ